MRNNFKNKEFLLGRFPAWIEHSLASIVAKIGYENTLKLAKETDVSDQNQLMRIL